MNTAERERLLSFPVQGGEITDMQWFDKGTYPENPFHLKVLSPGGYWRVTLLLKPTAQSHIGVVVCLPDKAVWNGRFLGTGNGGPAGNIAEGGLLNGLSRGFATANTDMGTPNGNPDLAIGQEEIWRDFGYRATHLMTVVGQQLTEWFYGKKADYSYFIGGSTGGQQAFSEAQRYPEDYDGIIALSPAFDRVRLHAWFVWNWQQIHSRENATFTAEQAAAWRDAVVAAFREECGSPKDAPYLAYPGRITENPMEDPRLVEAAERLLTPGQREALRGLYHGLFDPKTGESIMPGFLPGSEAEGLGLKETSSKDLFAFGFFYLFRWIFGADLDFMKFDFHADLQRAMERLSPILDATNTDLSAFKGMNHKLLVIGGSCDPIIPYTGFLRYYRQVIEKQGGWKNTTDFFRFFLMPGFAHTVGGTGVQEVGTLGISAVPRDAEHDALCAMMRWAEQGIAPERLLGAHMKRGEDGFAFDYALPADAYPNLTVFHGADMKEPDNYESISDEAQFL